MKEDLIPDLIPEIQVKSKERVSDFGEVFTNKREVNAMLDLVKDESYRIDSKFLEPACGTGNFLVAILDRKLETVNKDYIESQVDWEKQAFIAVSSIYAIDIQEDNCEESRSRMYEIIETSYRQAYPDNIDSDFLNAINYLLELNVIHGDGLTGLQEISSEPIKFSEFTFNKYKVKRKDFTMNDMVEHGKRAAVNEANLKSAQTNLFNIGGITQDKEELKPIKEFKEVNFKEVSQLE